MGRKAIGLSAELPSHANVPLRAKRIPAVVAKTGEIPKRLARKYVVSPAMSSNATWNHKSPLGSKNKSVSGKREAACISPARGWPSPSK